MTDQNTAGKQKLRGASQNQFTNWSMLWNTKFALMHIKSGFEQELYSLHEFRYVFAYVELLCSLCAEQRGLILAGIVEDAAENIFETPKLQKKRKKLDRIQKLYFDEYVYFQGMTLFSK